MQEQKSRYVQADASRRCKKHLLVQNAKQSSRRLSNKIIRKDIAKEGASSGTIPAQETISDAPIVGAGNALSLIL